MLQSTFLSTIPGRQGESPQDVGSDTWMAKEREDSWQASVSLSEWGGWARPQGGGCKVRAEGAGWGSHLGLELSLPALPTWKGGKTTSLVLVGY